MKALAREGEDHHVILPTIRIPETSGAGATRHEGMSVGDCGEDAAARSTAPKAS